MKQISIKWSLIISSVLLLQAPLATAQPTQKSRPNILFIAVDDLRPELGCYGSAQARTPNIDKLASEGMRFDTGYTTQSNGKIFHSPQDSAEKSWSEPAWWPKAPKAPTLGLEAETNRRLSAKKRSRIYEFPDVPDDAYPDGKTAAKTIDDLRRFKKDGKPFFLA